jgi:LmbE family N-acetylglucosaminyl deacetylase
MGLRTVGFTDADRLLGDGRESVQVAFLMKHPFLIRVRDSATGIVSASDLPGALGAGPWLAVAPHDDDLVLGMGLLAAAAARSGIALHVAVATDGALGYMRPEERPNLSATRAQELRDACGLLGIPTEQVHALGFPDGSLVAHQGCRAADQPDTFAQRLVTLLRFVRPQCVFVCTPDDVHPDHRVTAQESEIACVWAASRIWLERGEPCPEPTRFHYAVYAPFSGPPEIEIEVDGELFEQKLAALRAFASQGVIEPMIERLRGAGPYEYFKRARALVYDPSLYRGLFGEK